MNLRLKSRLSQDIFLLDAETLNDNSDSEKKLIL